MIKILISGCNGRMGRVIESLCDSDPELSVVGGFDVLGTGGRDFPVFSTPSECSVEADVIIDFSSPAALQPLLHFCVSRHIPAVLATTGYTQEQLLDIEQAATKVPLFRSANMSLGVNLLLDLVKRATTVLGGDYDIEIVERHHSKKVDAPSGTALMLADAAKSALDEPPEYVFQRQSVRKPRDRHEIGISAVRGGTIVGDHEVIFAGTDEVIELHHHAASRTVFASGALQAAKFLATCDTAKLYDMNSLISRH